MEKRVALITGGAKGVGRAVGLALAGRGWDVAFCWRTSDEAGAQTQKAIEGLGVRALGARCDVANPSAAADLVGRVEADLGRLDALVHCAGPYHRVDVLEETPEGWREMFAHNLDSLFYCSRAAVKGMIARKWGRIVGFSMANADRLVAQPQLTAHYVAKVGVQALLRSLAKSLAPHGVTANAISPGFIASSGEPDPEMQKMVKNIPAGYVGSNADAVSAVLFLLSDEARYVNGTNVHVSGAWGI